MHLERRGRATVVAMIVVAAIALLMAACATVRQDDLQSWVGAPAVDLDKHPVFLTMQSVRTVASDGTEIRNYLYAREVSRCSGSGSVFQHAVPHASYSQFTECMRGVAACNNIFYINNGVVTRYTPVGTGGARCFTDERVRPQFAGPSNFR